MLLVWWRQQRSWPPVLGRDVLPASLLGGVTGAVLLLVLPAEAFPTIVPVLIAAGLVMVVWGSRFGRRLPPWLMRTLIVVVGVAAIVRMVVVR